jgi:hypothetical protein
MKRFYCTVCKRIKRVRNLPVNIDRTVTLNGKINEYINPEDRRGICNRHVDTYNRVINRKVAR